MFSIVEYDLIVHNFKNNSSIIEIESHKPPFNCTLEIIQLVNYLQREEINNQ